MTSATTMPVTRKALICNKWELPILQGEPTAIEGSKAKSYYEYANDRYLETGKNALCVESLMNKLPQNLVVVEPFGGVGVFATVAQNVLHPKIHFMYDIDPGCVTQLDFAFPGHAFYADAKQVIGKPVGDIWILDWPFMTVKSMDAWFDNIRALFTVTKPKAVIWMDGASRYLHFHKERYAAILGEPVENMLDYAWGFSKQLAGLFGYQITDVAGQHACHYFLIQPMTEPLDKRKITYTYIQSGREGMKYL